ncbi:MFS transporter [Novosphingobium album (ex Liu et al. 2023)]|uniref:MFS transporter n=1 Tax=Novosphingobium album (ex Liu et al. 2023) TaxID=3031130 RepID=A0ABT5WX87_9SPHN|nr:MFS transporter [Novosphingobium album (ex Liu et al. 2023)]MDE8654513.1 MFS transporter [Novosphingobium album (ex Liu et al. 2023)]
MIDEAAPIAASGGPAPLLAPLRNRLFGALLAANLIASLGAVIQSVSASWLMTSLTHAPGMIALVQTATLLPLMLFSLATGAAADVFDARRVMLCAQLFMAAVSAALVVLHGQGWVTPWLLLGATFLLGIGTALHQPAWQASIGKHVPPADRAAAVTLSTISSQVARSAGPALGGVVVSLGGPALGFLVNAASYLGLVALLLRQRPRSEAGVHRQHFATAIRSGVQYAAASPSLRAVLPRAAAFGLCAGAVWGLMPLIARDLIGGGPVVYGLLLGAFGLGSVTSGAFAPRIRHRLTVEAIVRLGTLGFGAASLLAAGIAALLPALALMLVAGAAWVTALATMNVAVHAATPRWVMGRAFAAYQMALFGGLATGAWFWGAVADAAGLRWALAAAGAAMLATLLLGLRWPITVAVDAETHSAGASADPPVRVSIAPDSGPVTVMIDYEIPPERVDAFLEAMAEREHIRRRDGARRWALQQDLADPRRWVERFDSPRWSEYLHYRGRATTADQQAEARVRALHAGDEPPRVRRFVRRQPSAPRHATTSADALGSHPSSRDETAARG